VQFRFSVFQETSFNKNETSGFDVCGAHSEEQGRGPRRGSIYSARKDVLQLGQVAGVRLSTSEEQMNDSRLGLVHLLAAQR
jgi:hypothetical protein